MPNKTLDERFDEKFPEFIPIPYAKTGKHKLITTREDIKAFIKETVEAVMSGRDEAVSLLKECRPFLNEYGPQMTTLAYVSPAEQMRRSADAMERKEALIRKVDQFLLPNNLSRKDEGLEEVSK